MNVDQFETMVFILSKKKGENSQRYSRNLQKSELFDFLTDRECRVYMLQELKKFPK